MGFRCPTCHMDFGTDKKSFDDHIVLCSKVDIKDIDIEMLAEEHTKEIVYKSTIGPIFEEIMKKVND